MVKGNKDYETVLKKNRHWFIPLSKKRFGVWITASCLFGYAVFHNDVQRYSTAIMKLFQGENSESKK